MSKLLDNCKNITVSVILPVYNVEEYIELCLLSLKAQTLKSFEIIIVDDGSTDQSINKAERILKTLSVPWVIIKQTNEGTSSARNHGIKEARGTYIVCIDPDDIVAESFLETLYHDAIHHQVNVSVVNYKSIVSVSEVMVASNNLNQRLIMNSNDVSRRFLTRSINIIVPAMLIKRDFIFDNELWYDERMRFTEDLQYIWMVLQRVKCISYNKAPLYFYLHHPNSTMTASKNERIITGYDGFKRLCLESNPIELNFEFKEFIIPRWVFATLHSSAKMMQFNDYCKLAEKLEVKTHLKLLKRFPDLRVKILTQILSSSLRLFYWISSRF